MNMDLQDSMMILDQFNEIQNNYRTSAEDLSAAIGEVGAIAEQSGVSLAKLNGYTTALVSSTGISGQESGTALKSMMSRTFRLGASGEEDDEGKAQKTLEAMGIAVRDTTGDFRNFDAILDDVSKQWDNLTKVQQTNVAQTLGGTHHYSKVISLLNNYDIASKATESALNSQGSAMAENEKALDSVSGKWKIFMAELNSVKLSLFDNESLKQILDIGIAIASLISDLGGFKTVLAGILLLTAKKTGLFEMFSLFKTTSVKQFGKDLKDAGSIIVSQFKGLGKSGREAATGIAAAGTSGEVAAVGFGMGATAAKIFKAVLMSTVIFAIVFVIEKLISLLSYMARAKEELRNFNTDIAVKFTESDRTISQSESIYSQIQTVENDIQSTTNETRRIELQNKLLDLQRQMAEVLPATTTGYDENGNAIATNNEIIAENIRLKKEELALDQKEFLEKNNFDNTTLDILEKKKKAYEEMKLAEARGENSIAKEVPVYDNTGRNVIGTKMQDFGFDNDDMKELNQEITDISRNIQTLGDRINSLRARGFTDKEIQDLGFNIELYEKYTESIKENTDAKVENKSIAAQAKETAAAENDPITAGQDLSKAVNEAQKIRDLVNEINEAQRMTPSIMSEIIESYPDLADKVHNATELQDALNQKIEEQVDIQKDAYAKMIGDDNAWYAARLQNGNSLQSAFQQFANNFGDINLQSYDFDVNNFGTLNEAKAELLQLLALPMGELLSEFVGGNAEGYAVELRNFEDLGQAKAYVLAQLGDKMAQLQANYQQLINEANEAIDHNNVTWSGDAGRSETRWLNKIGNVKSQMNSISAAINRATVAFDGFNKSLVLDVPDFSTPSVGSGSGGGSGSNPEKDAQDERVKMEEEANRIIESLRDKLVSALKKKYEDLRKKELEPLDKEIEMKQKELERLQNGGKDEKERLAALKEELRLWQMNDSTLAKEKIAELRKSVKEAELNLEIKDLEDKKEAVNNKYDALLEEEKIYAEASKLIQQGKYDEMKNLLAQYGEDFKDIAVLLGKSVADLIKAELDAAKNAYNFLKGIPSSGSSSSGSSGSSSSGGAVTKGSKVKVTDTGAGIYIDSYGGSVGTWRGAGVSTSEGLYVVNMNNGRAALSRTNNIGGALGWIDMSKIARFATGGDVGTWSNNNGRLAVVDSGERVLTQEQNKLFGKLVYEILPQLANINPINDLAKLAQNVKNMVNTSNLAINNNYNVVNNTPFDVRKFEMKLEEMITKALNKAGVRVKY